MNIALGVLALAAMWGVDAGAQPRGRGPSINFSSPKNDTVSSNLNAFADPHRNTLKRLEDDLTQPLRMLNTDPNAGAAGMLPRPPAGPVIQNKKVRELLDKKKNWVFATPEEQLLGASAEQLQASKLEGQEGDAASTAFERYYQNLTRDTGSATNRSSDLGMESRDLQEQIEMQMQSGFAESAADVARERFSQADQGPPGQGEAVSYLLPSLGENSVMPDLFESRSVTTWQTRASESRMEHFKAMLQDAPKSPVVQVPTLPLPSVGDSFDAGGSSTWRSSLGGSTTIRPASPQLGASGFSSAGLASPGFSSLSQPPVAPPPARTPPPTLFREMPKRVF